MRQVLAIVSLMACFSAAARGTNNITGWVRNQSRGEPAAADEVVLVRLDRGMQEESQAKTDENGVFTFTMQDPGKPYLVRVIHQGVSYDQQVSADQALSIPVFDAATHVGGITGTLEILRTGTNGNLLHVSDLVEIKNESRPALTQAGERTFEVYLPANAKIDSVLAAGPGKVGVVISATPVPSEPGHYAVNFPLRPGATRFAFNYDLPYRGHATFQTRHMYPLRQMVIMIPPTMKFSSRSSAFEILATGNRDYQVHAANQLAAGAGPQFELFGTGVLPSLGVLAGPQPLSPSPAAPNQTVSAPGGATLPSLARIDTRLKQTEPPSQSLVLGAVTLLLLATCALLVWRTRKAPNFTAAQTVARRACQGHLKKRRRW